MTTGLVFNIQRFSIHDGPGIRTTVFLKGCPLTCFWCHNPEGIHPYPEIQYLANRCILCGVCAQICQHNAHILSDRKHIYSRGQCALCGDCLSECWSGAMELVGKSLTVDEVMVEALADRAFYKESGGGVTVSGGEPLLQLDFTFSILERCKSEGLHTAIETCAFGRWSDLAYLLPVTDLIIMDLKHLDPQKHHQVTGVSNKHILSNARKLAQTEKPLLFHTPVIPTVNDTAEEITAIAQFISELKIMRQNMGIKESISLELLPFHRLAADKYKSLGLDYHANHLVELPKEKMSILREIVEKLV